jgi:hypothetical protein
MAETVAAPPAGLHLPDFLDEFGEVEDWLQRVVERDPPGRWLDTVADLARESLVLCRGTAMAHLDLRDDNILIDGAAKVWICDWNWPLLGAPWLDLVTVLIAAHGDGLDVDAILAGHPLTRAVEPRALDAWLANLWLYFTTAMERPVPRHSPHLRDHQAWYAEVSEAWLRGRLGLA